MPESFSKILARLNARVFPRTTFAGPKPIQTREPFCPKLFTILKEGYTASDLLKDIIAGITVGIVALPLAMAFAISSGVPPIQGLYTAIIAGILTGFLGGSRTQISGPTGAFVVIIYGIVYRHGYDGLMIACFMAGIILLLAGIFRLGDMIKYVPYPVITGFTAGIAAIIFSQQVGDFFGMSITAIPPDFIGKWAAYFSNLDTISLIALAVGLSTLILMFLVRHFLPKIPPFVIAVLFGGIIVWAFGLPVETISTKFGAIPAELPSFQWPTFTMDRVLLLLPDAITIAFLAAIESLLTCVVADSITGDKHYSNVELMAQGTGNIACALFGGLPSSGVIARTATNIAAGARSPISAIIHGLTVLIFVLWLSNLASALPLASLAAILIFIAYGMFGTKAIIRVFKAPVSDWSVMILTFALTIFADLTVAVYAGVMLSSLLFMHRMSSVPSVQNFSNLNAKQKSSLEQNDERFNLPDSIQLLTINGPFFFGMVDRFQQAVVQAITKPKVYILQMDTVLSIDSSGLYALESFLDGRSEGYTVVLAGVQPGTRRFLRRMGLLKSIGENNTYQSLENAIARAKELVQDL